MTKRLAIIYTFLFLFAFTFGLAFTLASSAMADGGDNCCVYEWCHGPSIGIKGHFIGEWCPQLAAYAGIAGNYMWNCSQAVMIIRGELYKHVIL